MERNRRIATWAGAVLGIMFALAMNVVAADAIEERTRALSEEFHHSYPLTPNGTVELENINGAVHIASWDRNEVKLDAVKRADDQDALNDAEIEVNNRADSVSIRTAYRNEEGYHGHGHGAAEVEYKLTVPASARLDEIKLINGLLDISGVTGEVRASCINGKLLAHGLSAKVKLSTVNGSLEATFERLEGNTIELASVNGHLRVTLPSDVKAAIDATTVHGDINNDFGLALERHHLVGQHLRGDLGGGGSIVRLRNVNGAIDIAHANDGRALSPAHSSTKGESDI